LLVANAVGALLQNEIHSAPLYNTETHHFDGMFTTTDLMRLILYLDKSCACYDEALSEVSNMTIKRLNDLPFKNLSPEYLVKLTPDATLLDAAKLLLELNIHRLPIVSDSNLILSVLSQSKIVRFVALNVTFLINKLVYWRTRLKFQDFRARHLF
jgi:CBS domain-containing protein